MPANALSSASMQEKAKLAASMAVMARRFPDRGMVEVGVFLF